MWHILPRLLTKNFPNFEVRIVIGKQLKHLLVYLVPFGKSRKRNISFFSVTLLKEKAVSAGYQQF